jgi:hypothetical protein
MPVLPLRSTAQLGCSVQAQSCLEHADGIEARPTCLRPSRRSPDSTGSVATICSALPRWGCGWRIITLPRNSRDPALKAMQIAMMTALHRSARCLRGFGAMPAGYRSNLIMCTPFLSPRRCCNGTHSIHRITRTVSVHISDWP